MRGRFRAVGRLKHLGALLALLLVLVPVAGASGEDGNDGWFLSGTAFLAQDPENPNNDVIRIRTDVAPFFGTVSRQLNTKIDKLDNMLEFKSWFQAPKTCIGGAPRFQLAIDLNGDGTSEGNAFGYFGPFPSFAGCPSNTWLFEDLSGGGDTITGLGPLPSTGFTTPNEELEWDLTQFVCVAPTVPPGPPNDPCIAPQGFVTNWSTAETVVGAFPNHNVCSVALVDDTFGAPGMTGTAYYDIISGGRATFEDRHDIAGRGSAAGCKPPRIGDDDDDDDDHDHDDDHDDDDDKWDNDRKQRWKDD